MVRRVSNPPNPWHAAHVEWIGEPPAAQLEVYEETAGEVLTHNDSPDVDFSWSVNPYRGCFHGCAYCYARPYHEYLDFGAGTDFERKLVVKTNAATALRRAFDRKSWRGELVSFSGVTDCYQPLEASYGLTRACLEVCRDYRNPVAIITKSVLVERDVALLAELHERARVTVFLSIPFDDAAVCRAVEPYAPPPSRRFDALRTFADAGIETGIAVAPIIPGLNESDIPRLLERARDAGATRAFSILLRLPGPVRGVFEARMREAFPDRWSKIEHAQRSMRDGALDDARFGRRMAGAGERWAVLHRLFETSCRRFGLRAEGGRTPEYDERASRRTTFRRPHETPDLFA